MSRVMRFTALAVAIGLTACGDDSGPTPPEPQAGDVAVAVVSPNGLEGAVVLETSDGGIESVAATGHDVFLFQAGGISRIVLINRDPGLLEFTLGLEDVNTLPEFQIVEVAAPGNQLRPDLTEYEIVMSRAGGLPR